MGLSELTARLERDAATRIAALREKARVEAEALSSAAGESTAALLEQQLTVRRAERQARLERDLSAARQRARADVLRARHQVLERIFAAARALAAAAEEDPDYLAALPKHLAESLRYVEGQPAVVRCRPGVAARVRQLLQGRADVELAETPDAAVGVEVSARDGSVTVDDTLLARLRRLEPRLSVTLLAELER
jgi:vacuolar-type H+-ATPase subunit E/Vma4